MELNGFEHDLLRKLRNEREAWRHRRWLNIFGATISLIAGLWLLIAIYRRVHVLGVWDVETGIVCPISWSLIVQGIVLCVFTIVRWGGSPTTTLLLALYDRITARLND